MDKTLSVTSARQQLLKLTKDVRRRMDRVVLTNKGEAEAMLMSVGEYNSLKAAAELAMRPDILRQRKKDLSRSSAAEGHCRKMQFKSTPMNLLQREPILLAIPVSKHRRKESPHRTARAKRARVRSVHSKITGRGRTQSTWQELNSMGNRNRP